MDETWRLIHLVAAAFWLGGMIVLAVVAVIAARSLDQLSFRRLMSRTGQAFAIGSAIAWAVIGISGAAMAWPRLGFNLTNLAVTSFGQLLRVKTGLAGLVIVLTAVHALMGRSTRSKAAIIASRLITLLLFILTLGIFWLAVRMTEE